MAREEGGGLEGGLHAHDGHLPILLAQVGCRSRRGRVTGDDDCLCALVEKVAHDMFGEGAYLRTGLVAIRCVRRVPEVAEVLMRRSR